MKKPLAFYVGWTVTFIFSLKLYSYADLWLMDYMSRNYGSSWINSFPRSLLEFSFLIIIGILLFLLVYFGFRFEPTRKSAMLEFVIIGIPVFGLALLPLMNHLAYLNHFHYPEFFPTWLYRSPFTRTYAAIGGLLFGYELLLFIIRMVKCTARVRV